MRPSRSHLLDLELTRAPPPADGEGQDMFRLDQLLFWFRREAPSPEVFAAVRCPVLLLGGSLDRTVSSEGSLEDWRDRFLNGASSLTPRLLSCTAADARLAQCPTRTRCSRRSRAARTSSRRPIRASSAGSRSRSSSAVRPSRSPYDLPDVQGFPADAGALQTSSLDASPLPSPSRHPLLTSARRSPSTFASSRPVSPTHIHPPRAAAAPSSSQHRVLPMQLSSTASLEGEVRARRGSRGRARSSCCLCELRRGPERGSSCLAERPRASCRGARTVVEGTCVVAPLARGAQQ